MRTLILLTMLVSAPVLAEPANFGLYLGAGYLGSAESGSNNDPAVRANLGYRFNDNFAFDFGYTNFWLDDVGDVELSAGIADFSVVTILPVHSRVELFAKVGWHRSWIEAELNGQTADIHWDDWMYGAGLTLRATDRLDLKMEYIVLTGDPIFNEDTKIWQASFTYFFVEYGHN